jgi:hypothetical protein
MLLAVFMLPPGCTKKPQPEGYRVLSYDAPTHQWIILRNGTFDGKYLTKRLTVACSSYKWGDHEAVTGPDACHLQVGRMMIPGGTLSITEGDGPDRVVQQFTILKYEVLPDNANR